MSLSSIDGKRTDANSNASKDVRIQKALKGTSAVPLPLWARCAPGAIQLLQLSRPSYLCSYLPHSRSEDGILL